MKTENKQWFTILFRQPSGRVIGDYKKNCAGDGVAWDGPAEEKDVRESAAKLSLECGEVDVFKGKSPGHLLVKYRNTTIVNEWAANQVRGVPLRDYYAAHAPLEPQPWFSPAMRSHPVKDREWEWCGGCKGGKECDGSADCHKLAQYQKDRERWEDDENKARLVQWPFAWADEMLRQREVKP